MVTTNRSTLHTECNIQQSATQDSNDTTHRLSRRTTATTRGYRLPETDDAKVLPTSDQLGLYLASIHRMAPSEHTSDKQACYSGIRVVLVFDEQHVCVVFSKCSSLAPLRI